MLIALSAILLLICFTLAYVTYRCVKRIEYLVEVVENVDEQVEQSLDILDVSYRNIDHAAKLEVLSNEPAIREVMEDIRRARNAILLVANKVSSYAEDSEEIAENEVNAQ